METDVVLIDDDGRKFNRFRQEVIKCKWCGGPTTMTGTKMCDGCWELDSRISAQPDLAERMLREVRREADE